MEMMGERRRKVLEERVALYLRRQLRHSADVSSTTPEDDLLAQSLAIYMYLQYPA